MNNVRKIYIVTSSPCRVNNLDSERIKAFFKLNGYRIVSRVNQADLVIVNTCSNRKERLNESLGLIRKLKRQMKKTTSLFVCGCLPALNKDRLQAVFKGMSFGPHSYDMFDDIFRTKKKFSETRVSFALEKDCFCIPICKGCVWNCSYCVIKKARGTKLESRMITDIIQDIKSALKKGYKVIELQAEDVGAYGLDIGITFPILLEKILRIKQSFSLDIFRVNPHWFVHYFDILRKLLKSPKVRIFSLPIQSGSDKILRRMNREYRIKDIKNCLNVLRQECKSLKILTDIIVGFPGETNKDFLKSLNLIKQTNFDQVFVYKFSRWKNCAAYKYPDIIKRSIVGKRARELENESALGSIISTMHRR